LILGNLKARKVNHYEAKRMFRVQGDDLSMEGKPKAMQKVLA
jgi:hypothetical protein